MNRNAILEITGLGKSFWSVPVLSDIDLTVERGEVHALVGENGAGKSTLTKIISGAYSRDAGRILFDGREYAVRDPQEGLARGVSVIYQETSLVPTLTLMENVFLGIEPVRGALSLLSRPDALGRFEALCELVGHRLPPDAKARDVGPAERKLAEIAKALAHDATLLIMDEPTDCLSGGEIENFFRTVADLKRRGITIIYITHYLSELFRVADRITVLKDGRLVRTMRIADATPDGVVDLMLGRRGADAEDAAPPAAGKAATAGAELLAAHDLHAGDHVRGVSLTLRRGEITGLVGVIGSGKTELARLLFGADRADAGGITLGGRAFPRPTPRAAIRRGIGLVPEDRKTQGLLQEQTLSRNLTLAALDRTLSWRLLSRPREREVCGRLVDSLGIKAAGLEQRVKYLSGGNQQKVVLGKWLLADTDVLVMDEPTRGIDIGAKRAIYDLVRRMAGEGKAILFISSEVAEAIHVSDRLLVMRKGRIAGEFARGARQEDVLGVMLEAD